MTQSILEVTNLTKRFGPPVGGLTAVDNISFSVKEGEIVGLLGPNGAGKTTTLMMILGIIAPTDGTIKVFGLNFKQNQETILKQMNFSSAYTRAPWRLTIWEHLYVFALLYEVAHPEEKINELLEAFQLKKDQNILIGDLSSGNMARLTLCKAFINQPRLVLLDEPTSSLDPDIADRVRQFIKTSREKYKTTMLITSHNMAEIEELCDRVIFMHHGKIIAKDTPEELAKKIKQTRVRLMMRDGQKRTITYCREHKLAYSVSERFITVEISENDLAGFLNSLASLGVDYAEISIDKPTLEDYFIGKARHEINN